VGDVISLEKQEEIKLMSKLAAHGKLPAKPQSSFLQKRLQHRKFFDSGDYAMDKAKKDMPPTANPLPTADPVNHPMVEQANVTPSMLNVDVIVEQSSEDNLQIPRPETVPQRKASIINPNVHSKLSPQPLIHHEQSVEDL